MPIEFRIFHRDEFNIVGSPTVTDDGIASGFSSGNYLTIPNNLSNENNWSMIIPANITSFASTVGGNDLFSGQIVNCIVLSINTSGKLVFNASSNGTSWDIVQGITGASTLLINTKYYFKVEFTGTQYKVYYSIDSKTWNLEITVNSSKKIYNVANIFIGIGRDSRDRGVQGSIDLKEISITADGVEILAGSHIANIVDKLNYLKDSKELVRQSIEAKGVEVPEETPFRQYADKIGEISGGGELKWANITQVGSPKYNGKGVFSSFLNGKTSGSYFKDVWNTTKEPVILNLKFKRTSTTSTTQHVFDLSGGFQLKFYNTILRSFSWRDNIEHNIISNMQLNIWYYASIKIIPHEDYSDVEYYISTESFTTDPTNLKASFEINTHEYSGTIGIEGYIFTMELTYGQVDMLESCVTDYDGNVIKRFFPI